MNKDNPLFKKLRSKGTIRAMDFVTEEQTSYFNPLRDKLYQLFLDKGVILRPLGNTVYVMPPYCIINEDLEYVFDVIEKVKIIL
jgi:adenosylmethionine---8-amino-7-oxononanoate aminotransferase